MIKLIKRELNTRKQPKKLPYLLKKRLKKQLLLLIKSRKKINKWRLMLHNKQLQKKKHF